MQRMKRGYIVQILKQDGVGIIRETDTHTEYLYFLSDLSKRQRDTLRLHSEVTFVRNSKFDQFVAVDIKLASSALDRTA